MRYYTLFDDVHIPDRWHLGDIVNPDGGWTHLLASEPAEGPLCTSVTQGRVALDFCLTSFAVPVACSRLAAAMERLAAQDLQRLPLVIGRSRRTHQVLNCLRVVDCIDEARSETANWAVEDGRHELLGTYRSVDTLTVDPRLVPDDAHIFRTARWPVGLVVSEAMMETMKEAGARGAIFTAVT